MSNLFLRALKWGIIHLCTLNTSRDTMKFRKLLVFQFLHFCKKIVKSLCKILKNSKIQKIDAFCFQSYLHYYLTYTDRVNLVEFVFELCAANALRALGCCVGCLAAAALLRNCHLFVSVIGTNYQICSDALMSDYAGL